MKRFNARQPDEPNDVASPQNFLGFVRRYSTARQLDGWLLVLLVLAMCGQVDVKKFGRDTLEEGLGYATKIFALSLSDVVFALLAVWFVARTTQLKAWRKLWWPPLPCWALVGALAVAFWHAPTVVNALSGNWKTHHLHAITEKEPKAALIEMAQFAAYFLVAPWLFVNLMRDEREDEPVSRRSMALWAFAGGVALNLALGLVQMGSAGDAAAPRGLWSSPNLYGAFLAVALPLLWARALSGEVFRLRFARQRQRGLVLAVAGALAAMMSMITPFAAVALGFGTLLSSALRASARGMGLALLVLFFAAWSWRGIAPLYSARAPYLAWQEKSEKQPGQHEVSKRWVEWYAAQGWSNTRSGGASKDATFATGVGPGNYQSNIGEYYGYLPNNKKMAPDSNNFYLVQAVSLGVVGLAALLWVLGHFAGIARRAMQLRPADWLGAGVFASLASWLLVDLFHALLVRGLGLVLAFLLALAVVAHGAASASDSDIARPEDREA